MAGTPTLTDSYFLGQSAVFKQRVQTALVQYCNTIDNEVPTGVTGTMPTVVHQARKAMVQAILNPTNFANWLLQFTMLASADANVIAAATQASTTYTPITTQTLGDTAAADGQTPLIATTLISNAIAAAFNSVVSGV